MATSKVDIANWALSKLGSPKRLESLTQDTPNARTMNAAFNRTRDGLLRRYDWSFAIKRASIAEDATGTTWGDWNRFALPGDYIRLLRDDESGQRVDWRIEAGDDDEGLFILTEDAAPLEIRYVARIDDPNKYDALFIEALACKLAFETCEEVTSSTTRKAGLKDDYDAAIAEARRCGAIEKEAVDPPEDDWISARL